MTAKAGWAAAGAVVLFTIVCSCVGIDFGWHWDEHYNVIRPAAASARNLDPLPHWYYFPSLLHDLALVSAIPDAVGLARTPRWPAALAKRIDSEAFKLRLRRIVSVLAALTPLWLFGGVLAWRRSVAEALLAAAIAAGSWELQYHSRWVTADPLVAMFGAATLALCLAAYARRSRRLLLLSAVAAGLACGTKYPGGALLLPVLLTCASLERPLRRAAEALALFDATFFVTTPGALVEPRLLVQHLSEQLHIYGTGWGAYSVSGPAEHLRLLGAYLGLVQLSHFPAIAAFLAVAAIGGAVVSLRQDRRGALLVVAFPVAYTLYFATQRAMIVRNMQVLVPFLAVLAAIGIVQLLRHVQTRTLRVAAASGVAIMAAVNLGWLAVAAHSIAFKTPRDFVIETAAYLDANAHRKLAISRGVRDAVFAYDGKQRRRVAPAADGVEEVVFFSRELTWQDHTANRWNYSRTWFGPYEMNFNYYPTWWGRDRIVVAPPEHLEPFRR